PWTITSGSVDLSAAIGSAIVESSCDLLETLPSRCSGTGVALFIHAARSLFSRHPIFFGTILFRPVGGHQFMKQQSFTSFVGLLAGALLAIQGAAQAQSATIYGSVGNFDVANNQHKEAHGFELELEGVHPEDIASTFDSQRYGRPSIIATATGTIVRWWSGYDAASGFTATTAPHPDAAPLAGTCYQW